MEVIDARGQMAPLPLLELRKALDRTDQGGSVELVSDDPEMSGDVEKFLDASGHELVSSVEEGGSVRFRIRKSGTS